VRGSRWPVIGHSLPERWESENRFPRHHECDVTVEYVVNFDMDGYLDALKAKDLDRIVDYYAEDAVFEQTGEPEPLRGKDEIRRNMENFMRSFESADIDVEVRASEGNVTGLIMRVRASHKDDLEVGPGQVLPTEGKNVAWPVAFFVEANEDGKIARDRTIIDLASVMGQLDIEPEALRHAA
jgi:steroid delta-isomerase-like uncharacterized protein